MKTPEAIPPRLLRVIDANTNRIGEGLRFLEEIARMMLDDAGLTARLKGLRHELVRNDLAFQKKLLQNRDAAGDVGANKDVSADKQRDLPSAIIANSRRVQESLRVMEELGKIPGLPLTSENFQQARFSVYTIERELVARLLRQHIIKKLAAGYVIIDATAKGAIISARRAVANNANAIELYDNSGDTREFFAIAQNLKKLCARHGTLFIIRSRLDLALATDADGLHLEQEDLPTAVARRLLPIDKLLGVSVTTDAEAKAAQAEGADYIVTADSKTKSRLKKAFSLPVVISKS